MRTSLLTVLSLCFLAACSGSPSGGDAGMDGGGTGGGGGDVLFKVSGTAKVHPIAIDFLADSGTVETVAGLYLRVEEPLKVALSNPDGIYGSMTLDAGGAFEVKDISSDSVTLGVGAGVFDDGGIRVVRAATILFDVALQNGKPTADVSGTAFAVPKAFHDKLTATITPAKILTLTGANAKSTLIEAGFILGRVVDGTGKPVAGATMTPSPAALSTGFFYPTDDLSSLGTATSSNGLFIYVHNGGDVNTFRFTVTGKTEYKQRNAGATKDACLVVDVYPGTVAP